MDKTDKQLETAEKTEEQKIEAQVSNDIYDPLEHLEEKPEETKEEVKAESQELENQETKAEPTVEPEGQQKTEADQEKKEKKDKDPAVAIQGRLVQEKARREKIEAQANLETIKRQEAENQLAEAKARIEAIEKASEEHGFKEDIANIQDPQTQKTDPRDALYVNASQSLRSKIENRLSQEELKDFDSKATILVNAGQISNEMMLFANQLTDGDKLITEAVKNPLVLNNMQTAVLQAQASKVTLGDGVATSQLIISFQNLLDSINASNVNATPQVSKVPEQMEEQPRGGVSPMATRVAEKLNSDSFNSDVRSVTRKNFGDMAAW